MRSPTFGGNPFNGLSKLQACAIIMVCAIVWPIQDVLTHITGKDWR